MVRDFSEEALDIMIKYIQDYEDYGSNPEGDVWEPAYTWEEIEFYIEHSYDAKVCMEYIEAYHQELIVNHGYTKEFIQQIFEEVNRLDDEYKVKTNEQTAACYDPYAAVMQGLVDCISETGSGNGIMSDTESFTNKLDTIENDVLTEILNVMDPSLNGGDWSYIDEIMAKKAEDVTIPELAALNQILINSVSYVDDEMVFDDMYVEFYKHCYTKTSDIGDIYIQSSVLEKLAEYQQEIADDMIKKYGYVFGKTDDENISLTDLATKRENQMVLCCAIADISFAICETYSLKKHIDNLAFIYNESEEKIYITCSATGGKDDDLINKADAVVSLFSDDILGNYAETVQITLEEEHDEIKNNCYKTFLSGTVGLFVDNIKCVSKISTVYKILTLPDTLASQNDEYKKTKEYNEQNLYTNIVSQYLNALGGGCSFVTLDGCAYIRNINIDINETVKRVDYVNKTMREEGETEIFDSVTIYEEFNNYLYGVGSYNMLEEFKNQWDKYKKKYNK